VRGKPKVAFSQLLDVPNDAFGTPSDAVGKSASLVFAQVVTPWWRRLGQ